MSKWINVEHELPETCDWVLLTNGKKKWLGQLDSHLTKEFYCKCCLENLHKITYWMPYPALPENE
jgi:hypothetical protein